MIPLEASQISDFTPESLKNVVPQPTFRFRAATERDGQRYNHLLSLEGIRLWDNETVRGEILRVLKSSWDGDTFARESSRLQTAWAMLDQKIDVPQEEASAIAELTARCMDISPALRRMDADNQNFSQQAPAVALSMFLVGWSNVDVPFKVEAGVVPFGTMLALAKALRKIENTALEDKVEGVNPGLAFMQLSLHAFKLMSLDEEEEKNSSSPSHVSEAPDGSATTTQTGGTSEATPSEQTKTPSSRPRRGRKS